MNHEIAIPDERSAKKLMEERRFGPYRDYRNSGVNWLRDVPRHWEVKKLKHITSLRFSNVDKKSHDDESPVRLCNYVDVYYNDYITADIEFMEATATRDEITRFYLCKGDVLITKDSESWDDIAVPACVDSELQDVLCGYHLAQIRPHSSLVDGRFLFRAFASHGIRDQFNVAATGITRYGLSKDSISSSLFFVPPLLEQQAIAAFLDHETAKIDALVAKKERLIELLQEKRTALISQYVTNGLDSGVATKATRYPWLSRIPAHWNVSAIGWVARVQNGSTPSRNRSDYWDEGEIPWVGSGEVNQYIVTKPTAMITQQALNECSVAIVKKGSILVGMIGQGRTRGMSARLEIDTCINQNVAAIMPTPQIDNRFLHYALIQAYHPLRNFGRGGQQDALNCEILGNFRIPLPPLEEQRKIVAALDAHHERTERVSGEVRRACDCLREYRTALISAAVTGKIDVRKEVTPQ